MNAQLAQIKAEIDSVDKNDYATLLDKAPYWAAQLLQIALAQDDELSETNEVLQLYANESGDSMLFQNLELCRNVVRNRRNPQGLDLPFNPQ